ncbi:uncharacterized protein [Dysidea avara]|uniref:uncharacterized protein n=1 Tax=Dysidea avara TaxID=196820 RepID=UPI00331750C2
MTQREPVTVRIVHSNCGPGSSLPHFDSMKAYILSAVPDAVIIADNDDGRCNNFDFEIFVNEVLIYSRQDTGVYPGENRILRMVKIANMGIRPFRVDRIWGLCCMMGVLCCCYYCLCQS